MSFSDLLEIDFTSKIENNSKFEPAENEVFSLGTMMVETEEQDVGTMSLGNKEQDLLKDSYIKSLKLLEDLDCLKISENTYNSSWESSLPVHVDLASKPSPDHDDIAQIDIAGAEAIESVDSTFNNDLNVKTSLLKKTLENSKLNSNANDAIPSTLNASMKTKNQLLKNTLLNAQHLNDLNTQATTSNDTEGQCESLLGAEVIESVDSTFNNDLNVKTSLLKKTLENSKLNSNANDAIPSTFNVSMKTKNQLLKNTLLNAQLLNDSKGVANQENHEEKSLSVDLIESDNMNSESNESFFEIPSKHLNNSEHLMIETAVNDADPNQNANLEAPETQEDNQLNDLQVAYEIVNQTSTFADFENASFAEPTQDIISTDEFGDFSDFDFDKTPTPSVTDFAYFPNSLDHPIAPPSSPVDGSDSSLSRKPLEMERNTSSTILSDLETDHFPSDPAIKEDQEDFSMHPSTNYVELDFIESEDLLRKKDENSWWWKFPCL